MNIPNQLTVLRLLLVPVFVLLMSIEGILTYSAAYVVFVIAAITDYLDGRIARQYNLVTNFGKLMDPLADKVLVTAAFIMLMKVPSLSVPGWTVIAILAREFLVTGARGLAAAEGAVIAANKSGKTKTVIQITYICVFLFFAVVEAILATASPDWHAKLVPYLHPASLWAMVFVAAYTIYSGYDFARTNWRSLSLGQTA